MNSEDMALILLAAGHSRRFGDEDKLLADLDGRPLGVHMAERLCALNWRQTLAVVVSDELRDTLTRLGFETLTPLPLAGMGDNLALAARQVGGAAGVVVCLADMPFVPLTHIAALVRALADGITIAVSAAGEAKGPPVAFSAAHIGALRALSGDEGARRILISAAVQTVSIETLSEDLSDIDTSADLERARGRFG
ncbi:nucleotidyltransferase family protein [Asticcacaulis sp.]|uniref:nucleotidyltransferase family protein n=1 Tax=Asticcacaulis sp. TaxID=1872648 RepID=UPI0031D8B9EF